MSLLQPELELYCLSSPLNSCPTSPQAIPQPEATPAVAEDATVGARHEGSQHSTDHIFDTSPVGTAKHQAAKAAADLEANEDNVAAMPVEESATVVAARRRLTFEHVLRSPQDDGLTFGLGS
ncbi:hypothetical protein ONZ51_g12137 [Trametes cubensis]|uniref:Uncharacterized protein n=1 Tax=Trametes cubensis TaxID=1111947 RepID=A0AAD7TGF7_9APHY|nr:hypothetical protein ONZ51_g12137 [Trametes cubensis]